MLKLCYKNNAKRTDEYYFDLQSQKVYKICLSTYYAKQNTRGIPFVFISGGILAILLEQVSQRVLLPKNGRMLLSFLVIGILVLIDKKVKKSFIEKYQYIEEHTMGIPMEKEEVLKLYYAGEMEQKGIRLYCLYRSVYFSYWDVSCNTDNASYRNISGSIRWNNRGYLFSLRRICGSGKSKKMFTDK